MGGLETLSVGLWPSFVEKVQNIIHDGLEQLASEAGVEGFATDCENDLNRQLFFRMRRIAQVKHRELLAMSPRPALSREHTWQLTPVNEANNQPSPADAERTPRENKRPDFQWSFQDDLAEDIDRSTRTYVVECKRLGQAARGWTFNLNYVAHGIQRYIDKSHLYGKDDVGGGMIGYVQSMDISTIWAEVDSHVTAAGYAALGKPALLPGSNVQYITSHDLTRTGTSPAFTLHHVWVDLRPS